MRVQFRSHWENVGTKTDILTWTFKSKTCVKWTKLNTDGHKDSDADANTDLDPDVNIDPDQDTDYGKML